MAFSFHSRRTSAESGLWSTTTATQPLATSIGTGSSQGSGINHWVLAAPSITFDDDENTLGLWRADAGGDIWASPAGAEPLAAAPVVTVADHSIRPNQWVQLWPWVGYSDADGNPATQYQLWDSGTSATSGYYWTPNNDRHPANTVVTVNAADLNTVWVRGGSTIGSETMWVRAFDGTSWGNWDSFTLTTANMVPVVTAADRSVALNEWVEAAPWMAYSDGDGDPAVQYQVWDSGTSATSGYYWSSAFGQHAPNTAVTLTPAQFADLWIRGGSVSGSETLWVRAFDGTAWSNWDTLTLTTRPNSPPTVTVDDHTVVVNEWVQIWPWITYHDQETSATQFQVWDGSSGAATGYFWTPENGQHPAATAVTLTPAQRDNLWVHGGSAASTDQLYIRAFDGTAWSAWEPFTLTTRVNALPVAAIADHTIAPGDWARIPSWLTYSDTDGDAATQYQVYDGSSAGAYFWTPDNTHHPAGTTITLTSAQLVDLWVGGGAAGSSDLMYIRAFDGHEWGPWDTFRVDTLLV